jgi:serine phosphatase RsbU (regulator of sigma subunit)
VSVRWFVLVASAIAFALVAATAPGLLPVVNFVLFVAVWTLLTGPRSEFAGGCGDGALLVDLRARVLDRSALPALPTGWMLDTDLRSAHGGSLGGDFMLTGRRVGEPAIDRLEVVLVDVSGSGPVAGGRALLLAGALEALLDAVPRDGFMAAANEHLLRHGDDEGFATAVQVGLDLLTGRYELVGAGHPPAVHYRAGSGRWEVLDDAEQGPALGLLRGAAFPARSGMLARGDALLIYTDGLVENRELDVGRGIDRLLGHADTLLLRGGAGPAARISEAIRAQDGDDQALVVIRRT